MLFINPEYFVIARMSTVISTRSSANAKTRSTAKKAVLEVKAAILQKLCEFQIEEFRPKQRKAVLQLQAVAMF